MTKTLILSPRQPDFAGNFGWHDFYILSNAINSIAKGKAFSQAAPWMSIASKMSLEAEAVELGKMITVMVLGREIGAQHLPEFSVTLKNQECGLLWRELTRLKPEQFSANGSPLPLGALWQMLESIAAQFGEKIPEGDEEEAPE